MEPKKFRPVHNGGGPLKYSQLLLCQPALDPPSTTVFVGRSGVLTITHQDFGPAVMLDSGRSYIIPWSNIRHAEIDALPRKGN